MIHGGHKATLHLGNPKHYPKPRDKEEKTKLLAKNLANFEQLTACIGFICNYPSLSLSLSALTSMIAALIRSKATLKG